MGGWVKEAEVAGRGCVAIRSVDDDVGSYGFDEIPSVFACHEESEVPGIVERIRAMLEGERHERTTKAVDAIHWRNDWISVINLIREV